jgi:hypothetical protein
VANYWILVVETRTGVVVDELPWTTYRWNDSLDLSRTGTMSVTVPLLHDSPIREAAVRAKARGVASGKWKFSLALIRDGRALFAGPVVTHNATSAEVTLGCSSIAQVLAARRLIATGHELAPSSAAADVVLSVRQSSLPATLITLATAGYGRELPLVVPDVVAGETTLRTYKGADVASVLERLTQASEEAGGADVAFVPELSLAQTSLQWRVDVGAPHLGAVDSDWVWTYPTTCVAIGETGDASEQTHRGYVPGDAGGVDDVRPIGVAENLTLVADGWPLLERASSDTASVQEPELLAAQAKSYVAAHHTEAVTRAYTVDPDAWPHVGLWRFGDRARFHVRHHPWVMDSPEGDYVERLLGVSHGPGEATLETTSKLEPV